jgi:RNA polymerase sigma-70 factor (ECF subfamily)
VSRPDAAFDALYRTHAPSAFRRARRMLGSDADAHEVVHDVFLSLLERPEQFAGKSSMTTFLYSAVTHACLNRLRNRKTQSRLLADNDARVRPGGAPAPPPDHSATLRSALSAMPDPLAQVAVYYYMDELTHEEIARVLDCSRRHVGDLLQRLSRWAEAQEAAPCSP